MSALGSIIKVVNSFIPQKPELKEVYSEEWYFSAEGKSAYESLTTDCERTRFFLNYLRSIEHKDNINSIRELYSVAYVMANSMVNSKLEFSGYPNILDEAKNPFIGYIKSNPIRLDNPDYKINERARKHLVFELLKVLHTSADNNLNKTDLPYGVITFLDSDEDLTDMYKIERDIISGSYYISKFDIAPIYMFALEYFVRNGDALGLQEECESKGKISSNDLESKIRLLEERSIRYN